MADKPRSRLGRGLNSLLNVGEELPAASPEIAVGDGQPVSRAEAQELAVAEIDPNPRQPRSTWNSESLDELAASIRTNGIIQPLVVRRHGQRYQLIAGERRLRAAKLVGLKNVPVVLREIDDLTQAQQALVENIQREDLNPIDRAEGYRTLIDELGLTQQELAERLGEDRSTIANHLRLLDLAVAVREQLRMRTLTLGHAKVLAGISDLAEQARLGQLVESQELSVRNLERILQAGEDIEAVKSTEPASNHLRDLEQRFARQIGLKVQLRQGAKKGRGKVVIHYNSLDEFDDLTRRLGVTVDE